MDIPGHGSANHEYEILLNGKGEELHTRISFQNGPIDEEGGVNGIFHEDLLAIVVDRLKSFQAGKYSCRENALALTKIEEAIHWLAHRTVTRMDRGVEGTHTP